jgi:hypothetical protein
LPQHPGSDREWRVEGFSKEKQAMKPSALTRRSVWLGRRLSLAIVFCLTCSVLTLFGNAACAQERKAKAISCTWRYVFTPNGKTSKLEVTAVVPHSIPRRQQITVSYSHQPRRVFTKHGVRYAQWVFQKPGQPITIEVRATGTLYEYDLQVTAGFCKPVIPLSRSSLSRYLVHEKYLETNHPAIRAAARSIPTGKTDLETIGAVMAFVKDKLRYCGWVKEQVGAVKTLQRGQGGCAQFTELFVALCRAKQLPARFVTGTCTYKVRKGDTPKHAWAEVYMRDNGWVPFDPLHTAQGGASLEQMDPYRIFLTRVRNDPVLAYNNTLSYRFWGGSVRMEEPFLMRRESNFTRGFPRSAPAGRACHQGKVYLDRKEYDRAITRFTRAIRLNPKYVVAYKSRAVAYVHLQQYGKAIADYTRAIRIDPKDASAYRSRAEAYEQKGKTYLAQAKGEKARKALAKAQADRQTAARLN